MHASVGSDTGRHRGSWFDLAIAKSLRAGKLVYPGALDVPHAWAYLPDLARCFVELAQTPGLAAFERFHFPGHTLTGQQMLDAVERCAAEDGLAPPRGFRRGRLPWGLIRLLSFAVPMWRELLTMQYLWRVPHALDGTRRAHARPPAADHAAVGCDRRQLARSRRSTRRHRGHRDHRVAHCIRLQA